MSNSEIKLLCHLLEQVLAAYSRSAGVESPESDGNYPKVCCPYRERPCQGDTLTDEQILNMVGG